MALPSSLWVVIHRRIAGNGLLYGVFEVILHKCWVDLVKIELS